MDESGTPGKPGEQYPKYFVVGGIIIPEGVWHDLRDSLFGMKVRRKIRGELKWRFFAPSNSDTRNPMKHLSQAQKDEIRTEIYQLIRKHKSVVCLASVVSHTAAYKMQSVNTQDDVYHLAFKAITERFQYHLQDVTKAAGRREHGIVIADHRGTQDDRILRQVHQKLLHSKGETISTYKNFIEGLFLEPSHFSVGIQLADMIAGAVWRKFERNDDFWFSQLEPSFRRSATGSIEGYGLVKQPKAGWE